jgi:D-alanine transaminase
MQLAMVQDEVMPLEQLDAALLDRGLYFGDGVYEVMRSYNGKLFAFEDHMERFARSLKEIEIDNVDMAEIRTRVMNCYEKAAIRPHCKIYFHITRGSGIRNHASSPDLVPNFLLTIQPLSDGASEKAKGLRVCTYPDQRWKRCDIKSLNLLPNVLAKMSAQKKGCDEAILVDDKGHITEGSSSAFFGIVGGKLRTTPLGENILPSITRKYVFMCAKVVGLPIVEKSLTPAEATSADELFMGVTTRDIIGIVEFEGTRIGTGTPGPLTLKLAEQFKQYT